MILVKPSYEILDVPTNCRLIELAGRTCYKSEDRITEDSADKFVAMIRDRGHESVLEHEKMTVRFICDRGVSHEIVRHRLASFSQESTRYCDYTKGHLTFVIPPWLDPEVTPGVYEDRFMAARGASATMIWLHCVSDAERHYKELRAEGWKPEEARSVLPNSLKTEIVVTANLREWRLIFKQRTAAAAHPQMRELMIPLLQEMKQLLPAVFGDIVVQGGTLVF